MYIRRLFFSMLFISMGVVHAQRLAAARYVHYTTVQGLSNNSVTGLVQDGTGYIWISTAAGINRFDGHHFVQFHTSSDSISLASDAVHGVTWLNKREAGFYTTGLHILDTKTGRERNIFIPYHRKQFQYKFNMIERARGDEQGNVYVLSRSGFYHFDKDDKLVSRFDYYSEKDVPVAHFFFGRELLVLDENRLLIVSIGGLYIYDKAQKRIKKMTAEDCPPLAQFLDYTTAVSYIFMQPKPGSIFVLKSLTDTLMYVNIAENRSVASKLPFFPVKKELHYYSRLFPVNDSLMFITGHATGFFKMSFNASTGKVTLDTSKYFPNYQCHSVLKARDNRLWVATNKGLFRQDAEPSNIEIAGIPSELESVYPNVVMNEVYVNEDRIYVGTRSLGNVLLFDKKTMRPIRTVRFEGLRQKDVPHTFNIYAIAKAGPSELMLATDGPPFLMKNDGSTLRPLYPPGWHPTNDWGSELFRDSRENIWISSIKVYQYAPKEGSFSFIPGELQAASQIVIPEVIREDGQGNIWMAGHGLSRYNRLLQRFDLRLDSFPFIKMPDKQVSAMLIDKERNIIWFNSRNNGLISYDIGKESFRHFTTANGLPDVNIASLEIVDNKLWIAGYTGLACMDLKTYQITGFGKEDGFPDMQVLNRANFFYDSADQRLYLAFEKAIARFDPGKLLHRRSAPKVFFEDVTITGQKTIFLPANNLTTSWKDNEIRVTIGTINFSDASSQRYAYRIVKDDSTPWTNMGSQPSFSISSLSPGTHRIQVKAYSASNRWPEQVSEMSIVVEPPLWLRSWFLLLLAGVAMVLVYLLVRWTTSLARKKEMEKTHIEKLKADDYKNQFELEQISNYFSSSLADKKTEDEVLWDVAANLIGRMNYDDCIIYIWNKDKTKMVQKAAYGPKGKPEVINANQFEVAPGEGIVGHVIQTRQPLLVNDTRLDSRYRVDDEFRLSEVAVPIIHDDQLLGVIDSENRLEGYFSERDIKILTTIATLIGNKLNQIKSERSLEAKQRELVGINEQLAEARLSALQAQMNPHFVFNALNSIKRMILDGDNERASRYLSKFALMIRMTLEHSKQIFVTIDENIEYLEAYLDMEKLRFDDTFTYNISLDEQVDSSDAVMPSMMIQPLVENAIWHGLMHADADKRIRVSFTQTQNKVICTVEDNGIGIQRSEKLREKNRPLHRSVGLENLQKRIKIINEKYDTACSLHITDLNESGLNGSGTKAVLEINLITL